MQNYTKLLGKYKAQNPKHVSFTITLKPNILKINNHINKTFGLIIVLIMLHSGFVDYNYKLNLGHFRVSAINQYSRTFCIIHQHKIQLVG